MIQITNDRVGVSLRYRRIILSQDMLRVDSVIRLLPPEKKYEAGPPKSIFTSYFRL